MGTRASARNDPQWARPRRAAVRPRYGKTASPYNRARCDAGEATTTSPAELLADSVVVLEGAPGSTTPLAAIIVENQRQPDSNKQYSWPSYVANLRHRLRCPVKLLVLTPTQNLAYRCAEPIDLGCGELRPVALPMTKLDPVTDAQAASREPHLAILTAIMRRTENPAALRALLPALDAIDQERRSRYSDLVYAALPATARELLEEALSASTYEWKSDLARESAAEGKVEGKAEGKAEDILAVLHGRGLTVTDSARQRIIQCADLDQLNAWIARSGIVDRTDDLFC